MRLIKNGSWCVSKNDDFYNGNEFSTREEAINSGKEAYKNNFFIGELNSTKLTTRDNLPFNIIEAYQEDAIDNAGEIAETWLDDVLPEHQKELEKGVTEVIVNWMNQYHYHPNWRSITNIEYITLEEERSDK